MLQGVDRADAEQVVDEAARPRAADGAADATGPDAVGDVRHREEVGGHAGLSDDVQLVLEAIACHSGSSHPAGFLRSAGGRAVAAVQDRVLAAFPEFLLGLVRVAVRLRQVVSADAQVTGRIQDASFGELGGGLEEAVFPAVHRGGDALGDRRHVGGTGEVRPAVVRLELGRAERDQVPGRVKHLGGQAVGRVQVPDGVGQHGLRPGFRGEVRHPRGADGALAVQVVDDLDGGVVLLTPAVQGFPGQVRAAGGDRLADVAGRAEQDHQAVRVLGDQVLGHGRVLLIACAGCRVGRRMGFGNEAAQRGPSPAAGREQRHPARWFSWGFCGYLGVAPGRRRAAA